MSILVEIQLKEEKGVPEYGANLSSPVVNKAQDIDQIYYKKKGALKKTTRP